MRDLPIHPFDDDKLKEECGVFGVIGVADAASIVALGMHALQHRGQEAGGIITHHPDTGFHSAHRFGLVRDNFTKASLIEALPGRIGIEGTRPMLTEIQALVTPSPLGTPRRTVVGLDGARLSTIMAVLEARCGIPFAGLDVFLNVAGGMRVSEPAADLAVAAALLSAREDIAVPFDTVVFGEISLSGALRPVGQTENRLKEAQKLGFNHAIAPAGSKLGAGEGMRVRQMPDLTAFVGDVFGAG